MSGIGVFWDFDCTLAYRAKGRWGAALIETVREVCPGSDLRAADLSPHLRSGFPWHEPERPHLDLCEPEAWWDHMGRQLSRVLVRAGIGRSDAETCAQVVRKKYLDPSSWVLFEDTVPALAAVSEQGAANIVLSNHVPELEWLASELGLSPFLDGVLTSALTGYEKPNRRAFEVALEFAGYPAAAYMVGDSLDADVLGANAVGLEGILVARSGESCYPLSVSRLTDVATLVCSRSEGFG